MTVSVCSKTKEQFKLGSICRNIHPSVKMSFDIRLTTAVLFCVSIRCIIPIWLKEIARMHRTTTSQLPPRTSRRFMGTEITCSTRRKFWTYRTNDEIPSLLILFLLCSLYLDTIYIVCNMFFEHLLIYNQSLQVLMWLIASFCIHDISTIKLN